MTRTATARIASRPAAEILGLAFAMASVAAALALTLLLKNVISSSGYLFFYVAVVVTAWLAGFWAGGSAVILSVLAVAYYLTPPIHSFAISRESLPLFIEFAASAVVVGWFSSWRKQAETELRYARDELQLRVEERTAELKETNGQLVLEIAERRRAEAAYFEAQAELERVSRMSAMSALAASISHEVNQPLAAVVTNADACMIWLGSDPPNLEEARLAVDCIAQQGTRASEVVRHIRSLFTKNTPERTDIDVNQMILEVCNLVEGLLLRNEVTLRTDLAADLASTTGDRVQLQQVIVNLVVNSIEAMNQVVDRPRRLEIRSTMCNPGQLLVAVRDTGSGIAAKDERRLFDAFFTTKAQGMGMGLSISYSIIEAHGGRLWATRNDDFGATVQFTLPARQESA